MSMSFNGAEEERLCHWPKNPVSRRRLDSHLRQWSERGTDLANTSRFLPRPTYLHTEDEADCQQNGVN